MLLDFSPEMDNKKLSIKYRYTSLNIAIINMKERYLTILITMLIFLTGLVDSEAKKKRRSPAKQVSGYVYICTGPNATAYHRTPRCSGLNRCSGIIEKVSKLAVTDRHPCGRCY